MAHYHKVFPDVSKTPKMHMLERHMETQITTLKFGMGLLGEQGAESIHSIERAHSGIPNRKDCLLRVVQEHYLSIEPDNIILAPIIKKRKIDKSNA